MEDTIRAAGRIAALNTAMELHPFILTLRHGPLRANIRSAGRRAARWRGDYIQFLRGAQSFPRHDFSFAVIDTMFLEQLAFRVSTLDHPTARGNARLIYNFMRRRGVFIPIGTCAGIIDHIRDSAPPPTYITAPNHVAGIPRASCFTLIYEDASSPAAPHTIIPIDATATIRFPAILDRAATPPPLAAISSPAAGRYYIVPTTNLQQIHGIIIVRDPASLAAAPVLTV